MTTFVLVPGFWVGAWVWRDVTKALRAHGHDVYPMTLTGLAERSHLARPDTDLELHVTDVVNLLRYEDLRDVVLVGHSYGGLVVTAVADRVTDRVGHLAYIDSGPLPDGAAQRDFDPSPDQPQLIDGWRLPPPPWEQLAAGHPEVDASVVALLRERSVDEPWLTAASPLRLTGAWEKLPRLAVLSSFTVAQMREMAATAPLMRHMVGDLWRFEELPTWHWPMLSRPAELAEILHNAFRSAEVP
jgi:pimeloyl-ACP methyl ester carboxylesterase